MEYLFVAIGAGLLDEGEVPGESEQECALSVEGVKVDGYDTEVGGLGEWSERGRLDGRVRGLPITRWWRGATNLKASRCSLGQREEGER